MAAPDTPTLYYLDNTRSINDISSLATSNKIEFETDSDSNIEIVENFSDSNTVEEPTISSDGTHSINKQDVGALPQGIVVSGYVRNNTAGDTMMKKLRSFSRLEQLVEDRFEYGRFGFYSNVATFFDVHPTRTQGYILKPPTVSHTSGTPLLRFSFRLLVGGVDLA